MVDDLFFIRWQRALLWCANTWLGKLYLTSGWSRSRRRLVWRWIDAPRFDRITPSSFTFMLPPGRDGCPRYASKFYADNHFGKKVAQVMFWLPYERVEFTGAGLRLRPTFAYGVVALLAALVGAPVALATVSAFNPATGASSPVDGHIEKTNTAGWNATRSAATGDSANTTASSYYVETTSNGSGNYWISRLVMLFNTGGTLPSDATITAAQLAVRTGNAVNNPNSVSATVVQSRPASDSTLATSDYNKFSPVSVTAGVPMTEGIATGDRWPYSSYVNDTTVTFTLNATGRAWVARSGETLPSGSPSAGLTRLGLTTERDATDVAPTGQNYALFILSDNGSNKPQLSVTWSQVPNYGATSPTVLIGGVDRTGSVDLGSIVIRDVLNQAPNTMTLTTRPGFTPTRGQEIKVYLGGSALLLFAGTVQTVEFVFQETQANKVAYLTCVDYTWTLDNLKVSRRYGSQGATTTALDLISSFAPTFTSSNVAAGLPNVAEFSCEDVSLSEALTRLANLIGGYWYVDYERDVHFFLTETFDAPAQLDDSNMGFWNLRITEDISQVRTRLIVEGGGAPSTAQVPVGCTQIPVADLSWYSPSGGLVKIGPQRVSYTGVASGQAGAQMGTSFVPTNAPTTALKQGTGVTPGEHLYAVTFVDGTGETTPGPTAVFSTGVLAAPVDDPTANTPTSGGNVDTGNHDYRVTFVTSSGETTPGPIGNQVTTGAATSYVTPPSAPSMAQNPGHSTNYGIGDVLRIRQTYRTAAGGETTPSSWSSSITVQAVPGQPGVAQGITITSPVSGDGAVTAKRIYVERNGVETLMQNPGGGVNYSNGTTSFDLYSAQTGNAPTVNTAVSGTAKTIPVSSIPTGPADVTSRKLYRRFNGSGNFKLVTTISNNTATTYTDTTANASLGANAPTTNTTVYQQADLSSIPVGPAGTTQRKVYRTVAGGAQLKLLTTLANNTTTTYADSTADGSLGANAPTTNTSGLVQETGTINAGVTSIPVTSIAPFSAAGGWAFVGSLPFLYGGVSGMSLTGIPASGAGALSTSARYGQVVGAAPVLTGVPSSGAGSILYQINAGEGVNVLIIADDTDAQTALASALGFGDGVREHFLQDRRLSLASITAAAAADLLLFSAAQTRISYETRDTATRTGKTITVFLPDLGGDYQIQTVTISQIGELPGVNPRFAVQASSTKFSFEDLLRRLS